MKKKGTAYLLWLLGGFGILGFHRFYLGKVGTGILWICTVGLAGIGAIYDLFTLGRQVDMYNALRGGNNANTNTNTNTNTNNNVNNIVINMPQQQPLQQTTPAETK